MNAIARPATGLDMLLLFAGENSPVAGVAMTNAEGSSFADLLTDATNAAKSACRSNGSDGMPVEMPVAPPAGTDDVFDPSALVPLPLASSVNDSVTTSLPIEQQQPTPTVSGPKYTSIICDSCQPDNGGDSLSMRAIADELSWPESQSQPQSTIPPATAKFDPFETVESVASSEIVSASSEDQATERLEIEAMRDPDRSTPVQFAPNLEPAPALQFIARQIRDNVMTVLKASAVVRSPREVVVAPAPQRPVNRQEHLDRKSGVTAESMSFHEAAERSSDQPIHESEVMARLEAPTLVDELAASAERVDHASHEVVVELNIPDWGVLEIEVTRNGDETEVSLLADPGLNQMLLEHLPELTEALSASGIEFTGLDVRHHEREQLPDQNSQPIVEMFVGERETPSAAPTSTRTALSRYRLMSITA